MFQYDKCPSVSTSRLTIIENDNVFNTAKGMVNMKHKNTLRLFIAFTVFTLIAAFMPITSKATGTQTAEQASAQLVQLSDEAAGTGTPLYTDADAVMIAKVIYNEARGIPSDTEKACIVWVILNRVDAGYADTISGVVTARYQFAYNARTPVWDELLSLSYDVLGRWAKEKQGQTDVGRVLPKDYLWYTGNGVHNLFRNSYSGKWHWNYSLPSPYTS